MCDSCDDKVTDMILDFVLLGMHLEVAVRLTRDTITQGALSTDATLEEIRDNCDIIADAAGKLRAMSDEDFRAAVVGHAVLQALS